ncbi:hypothetical protein K7W42_20510 [Deinococcus sp. HMF7604]|uniref:hypothetical protein n=1 Tax=Deinococcus betulae TaxID=2873312 RepID=UPI001CCB2BE5|nr:hypothetical protein [Deinococcus betulae]MBZ9753223.1 hypothetical protein [Deinococcus betulae]
MTLTTPPTSAAEVLSLFAAWMAAEAESSREVGGAAEEAAGNLLDRLFDELSPEGLRAAAAEVETLQARVAALEAALTPTVDTRAAYAGEFRFQVRGVDEEGEETDIEIDVPWDTIKTIMAAIRAEAAS